MLKDLNRLKECVKIQKASYDFKLGFALSNRPHLNSVYLVRVPFLTGIAVTMNFCLSIGLPFLYRLQRILMKKI